MRKKTKKYGHCPVNEIFFSALACSFCIVMTHYTLPYFAPQNNSKLLAQKKKVSSKMKLQDKFKYVPPKKPAHFSNYPPENQTYIMIIDHEHKPSPIQCAQYESWIPEVKQLPFIDNIEFYSMN